MKANNIFLDSTFEEVKNKEEAWYLVDFEVGSVCTVGFKGVIEPILPFVGALKFAKLIKGNIKEVKKG